jgi:hypothetical protein
MQEEISGPDQPQAVGPPGTKGARAVGRPRPDDETKDWSLEAEGQLDRAEEAGDETRLAVLEDINEKLEAELDLDRPRPAGGAEEASEGGEAQPPGR